MSGQMWESRPHQLRRRVHPPHRVRLHGAVRLQVATGQNYAPLALISIFNLPSPTETLPQCYLVLSARVMGWRSLQSMLTEVEIKPRTHYPPPSNAWGHLALVTFQARDTESRLFANRQLLAQVRAEMEDLKQRVELEVEVIEDMGKAQLQSLWKFLEEGTQRGKEESVVRQEEIDALKREKMQLSQMIMAANRQLQAIKTQVGDF